MMEHDCDESYAAAEVVFRNLRHLLGFNETYSVHAVANRLADLIEPLPERTCRNEPPMSEEGQRNGFLCTACGYKCFTDTNWGKFHWNYCPNCGAKVVEEE